MSYMYCYLKQIWLFSLMEEGIEQLQLANVDHFLF